MSTGGDFQMVCANCGCLGIKIEDPERAPAEATVYCSVCGASRGNVGALRDLALRPDPYASLHGGAKPKSPSKLVTLHNNLQSLRRKGQTAEPSRKP